MSTIGNSSETAARILRQGGIVALPTETVYGLGGNALDVSAVAKIFAAKQRPEFDPLIVHVPDTEHARQYVTHFPPLAERLAARFWPGPLTLVLPKRDIIPDLVTSGLPEVGLRVPAHPLMQQVLRLAELPIAAPSANLFGRISPTTAQHVAEQLADRVDYILDGGPCAVGVESTVLQLTDKPRLLRPGGVSLEELESLIGPIEVVSSTDDPGRRAQVAPGMLPQHYAPNTPLQLIEPGTIPDTFPPEKRIGLLRFSNSACLPVAAEEILAPTASDQTAAANLFAALRRLDSLGLDLIIAELLPEQGLGRAINDRLRRAAAR
ncbi:MAG: threonylcarbamoyl-AMP synthase [Planctomycetaceae bacterium]|nr:threonylcarbamoyl-AMP synthase [Planctomycetaceae bacterium]